MNIDFHDLNKLCAHVHELSKKYPCFWPAQPLFVFEFDKLHEFASAYAELHMAAVQSGRTNGVDMNTWRRTVDPDTVDLTLCGITFRLSCTEHYGAPSGEIVSAGDVSDATNSQVNFLKGLAMARNGGGY